MARMQLPQPLVYCILLAGMVGLAWVGTRAFLDGLGTLRWLRRHPTVPSGHARLARRISSELADIVDLGPRWVWTLQPLDGGGLVKAVLVDGGPLSSRDTVRTFPIQGSTTEVRLSASPRYTIWGPFLIAGGLFVGAVVLGLGWLTVRFFRAGRLRSAPPSA